VENYFFNLSIDDSQSVEILRELFVEANSQLRLLKAPEKFFN
jgi:hypothetical protein